MKLPLQARVVVLIGGSLAGLQLGLAWLFTTALDESELLRRQSLQNAAVTALEQTAADTARTHAQRLKLTAELAREQAAETILVYESESPEPKRGLFSRLFGGKPPDTTPIVRPNETRRLSASLSDVREYRDGEPTLWLLKSNSMPDLNAALRNNARQLATSDAVTARWVCEAGPCALISAQQFRTTDGVRIVVTMASTLDDVLATLEQTGGYTMARNDAVDAPTTNQAEVASFETLGGVAVAPAPLAIAFTGHRGGERLSALKKQYLTLAFWGLLLSVLLLALLMRGVIQRVTTLSSALPQLTMGRFDAAREALKGGADAALARDETHDLLDVAETVTVQLANMRDTLVHQADALRGERDHVRLLLDTVPACVVLLEADTTVRSCNRLMGELLGHEPQSMHGKALLPYISAANRDAFANAVAHAKDERSQIETVLLGTNKNALTLHWHLVAMADGQVLAIGLDVTNLRAAQQKLQWQAEHDLQTGLLNRRTLTRRLLAAEQHCTIVLITPGSGDHYNETLDDNALTKLRKQVAERLQTLDIPATKIELARLARLDFAALVWAPRIDVQAQLEAQFERIRGIETHIDDQVVNLPLHLLGIDWPADQPARLSKQVLRAATSFSSDTTACVWPDTQRVESACRDDFRHWVARIDDALTNDKFELVYQPIYNAQTLRPAHSEALVRMRDDDGSLLSPGHFIPHAEQSGQVLQIERVVLALAIDCALRMQANKQVHVLSVNIAARSLRDDALYQYIAEAVEQRGLQPQRLMLEILESQSLDDVATAAALMQRFKALGVGIALDDFGIGFTSFEYLREIPFDYVKIDQLFVRQLSASDDDQRLIRAIHDIASGMGRKTIAEGVEDAQSLSILREIGIDAVQGYLLSAMHDQPNLEAAAEPA